MVEYCPSLKFWIVCSICCGLWDFGIWCMYHSGYLHMLRWKLWNRRKQLNREWIKREAGFRLHGLWDFYCVYLILGVELPVFMIVSLKYVLCLIPCSTPCFSELLVVLSVDYWKFIGVSFYLRGTPSGDASSGDASEGSQLTEERLTKEEWQAINNLLSYQPDEELSLHSGQNMIRFLVTVSIGQAGARIISMNETEIICGRFEQLHVSTKFKGHNK